MAERHSTWQHQPTKPDDRPQFLRRPAKLRFGFPSHSIRAALILRAARARVSPYRASVVAGRAGGLGVRRPKPFRPQTRTD